MSQAYGRWKSGWFPKGKDTLRNAMAPFLIDLLNSARKRLTRPCGSYNKIRYMYRLKSEERLPISTSTGPRFPGYCSATDETYTADIS